MMQDKSVGKIQDWKCSHCGVCVGICAQNALKFQNSKSGNRIEFNREKCTNCGLCSSVCPYYARENKSNANFDSVEGKIIRKIVATQDDPFYFVNGTSSGIATLLLKTLLELEKYDSAFCVSGYNVNSLQFTQRITVKDSIENTFQSRYIRVSHDQSIKYLRQHRNEHIIFCGTGCAIEAINNAIAVLHLPRENFLLIGFFCSGVMDDKYISVLNSYMKGKLQNIKFRSKDKDEWHGIIKMETSDGQIEYLSQKSRIKMKRIMMPERCAICSDYYNLNADIVFGDNNEGQFNELIMTRTNQGEQAFLCIENKIRYEENADTMFLKVHPYSNVIRKMAYGKARGMEFPSNYVDTLKQQILSKKMNKREVAKLMLKRFIGKHGSISYLKKIMLRG